MSEVMELTIEPEAKTSTALTVIKAALPTIIGADKNDILGKLAEKVRAFVPDPSTKKGQDAIRSLAAEIASSKMDLIRLGKSLTADWRKQTDAVNAECKVIEERMDALKTQVRQPLTDFENAEKARTKANEDNIAAIEALAVGLTDLSAEEIKARYAALSALVEFQWSIEFTVRAERTQNGVIAQLELAHAKAKQREADAAAEVVRLAEEAERQRLAAIEAQRLREEQIACEAAERARHEAEAKAVREAEEARQAAQAERDAAAAREREAAEALERAERARIEAEQRAERERVEAIERERIAAERAEINRLAEIARAEREKAEAVEAERRRMEAVRATEEAERARQVEAERVVAEKRAANRAHQAKINGEALAAIMQCGADEEMARAIIKAIARGEVPHTTINY